MNVPGGIPGYLLAGLIYRDGFFDGYDMPDDARYAIERTRWLHDLYHVLTGYGTDLAGEGLLIYFQLAYRQPSRFSRCRALVPWARTSAVSASERGPAALARAVTRGARARHGRAGATAADVRVLGGTAAAPAG